MHVRIHICIECCGKGVYIVQVRSVRYQRDLMVAADLCRPSLSHLIMLRVACSTSSGSCVQPESYPIADVDSVCRKKML